jgi:hypothetical protein
MKERLVFKTVGWMGEIIDSPFRIHHEKRLDAASEVKFI